MSADNQSDGGVNRHSGMLKKSLGVVFATLLSRILGLVRVRFEANVLGGAEIASGWHLAFAIPNLLRRILGEGALGNALMPLVADIDSKDGKAGVRKGLGTVFFILGIILAAIVILVAAASVALAKIEFFKSIPLLQSERMQIVLELLPLLMPYGFFMCLVGIAGSVLNYCREFFLPALGALLLNIFLISGLAAAYFLQVNDFHKLLKCLTLLVLLSGCIQLLLMFFLLYRNGSFPDFRGRVSFSSFKNDLIKKLFSIALPGMIGGVAVQVSFLVDRMVAVYLGAQAVPALTYVDRLIDLPIGIFAMSLGAVLMSEMSRSAAKGDMDLFVNDLQFSMRHVFFFCIPMGAGVVFFYDELMSVLCLGGRYTSSDLEAARMVAMFYGAGIPVFCLLKVIGPAFYSRKKMMVPLYASLCAIVLNIILNFILMRRLQQGGIALATVISSVVNCAILLCVLKKQSLAPRMLPLAGTFIRSLITAAGSGWITTVLVARIGFASSGWSVFLLKLIVSGSVFGLCYFGISALLRAAELKELSAILFRRGMIK